MSSWDIMGHVFFIFIYFMFLVQVLYFSPDGSSSEFRRRILCQVFQSQLLVALIVTQRAVADMAAGLFKGLLISVGFETLPTYIVRENPNAKPALNKHVTAAHLELAKFAQPALENAMACAAYRRWQEVVALGQSNSKGYVFGKTGGRAEAHPSWHGEFRHEKERSFVVPLRLCLSEGYRYTRPCSSNIFEKLIRIGEGWCSLATINS